MADFPSGIILLWHGAIVDIPAGWTLCDGTHGTPNLQNKFIPGAGDVYAVGDLGGSISHTHAFTSNTHRHTLPVGTDIESGSGYTPETSLDAATGTTDAADTRPPYHALAWIMKL